MLPNWKDIERPSNIHGLVENYGHECFKNQSFLDFFASQEQSFEGLFNLGQFTDTHLDHIFWTAYERISRQIRLIEETHYSEKKRRIFFLILGTSDIQAFANTTPEEDCGFDYIGISFGTILTLHCIFYAILSHPKNFPEVGNCNLEDADRLGKFVVTNNYLRPDLLPVIPNCQVRQLFAGHLMQSALDFLLYHEATHLRNGHCEFCRETFNFTMISEVSSETFEDDVLATIQALEWDADCGAGLHSLRSCFYSMNLYLNADRSTIKVDEIIEKSARYAFGNKEMATRTALYSAYVLFRIIDGSVWTPQAQRNTTHPMPAMRMFWLIQIIAEIFQVKSGYDYDPQTFLTDSARFIASAEMDIARVQGAQVNASGILSVLNNLEEAENYRSKLDQIWKRIRPTLEKYKRGGNLPQ